MLRTFLLLFATFAALPAPAAELTERDVTRSVRPNLVHPYLFFDEAGKLDILDRISGDPACNDIFRRKVAEANRLLHTPVSYEAPPRSRDARFDGTYDLENFNYANTNNAYDLAFIYQMTGDTRYADKAFEFVDVVCDQPTWVHGAHWFPIIYDRIWPMGADDDQVVFSFAQASDHIVTKVAAVYDWLYPTLTKRQRDRIRGALLEKAILTVRNNYEYHWWATAYRCNWCSVCHGSLGIAAMALLTEDPNLVDVVAASFTHISRNLDEIRSGGWQEGIGYLNYTLLTSMQFASVLKNVTGGKLNLFKHPRYADGFTTLLYCQIVPNKSVHFGDSSGGSINSWGLYNKAMLETDDRRAAWLRQTFTSGNPATVEDFFMPRSTLEPQLPSETSILFPDVGWVIMRSDFTDPGNIVIAAKSGPHDDPHHGHLDSGHVSLYWHGTEFLTDHGSAGYDREYFDDARWEKYPLAINIGHNTLMVNGERQIPGKRKNQPWQEGVGGRVALFRPGLSLDYAVLDPTKAYPNRDLKRWRRHVILDKPDVAVIVDEVSCKPGGEIVIRFHSAGKQTIMDGWVRLDSGGDSMALIPLSSTGVTIREGKHAVLPAQKNGRFRWAPYVDTNLTADRNLTVAAAIVLPLEPGVDPVEVLDGARFTGTDGGTYQLTFTAGGRICDYRFERSDEGLILVQ